MKKVEELIKRKKKENILLSLLLITICMLNLILNFNNYVKVVSKDYYEVNDIESLNKSIKNKEKFIIVNLKNAKLESYSLANKDNVLANLYTLNMDNKNILILLKPNTILTTKVFLEILNDTSETYQIKDKLNNNYYDKYLSNVNYDFSIKFESIKLYVILLLLTLSIISIIINVISIRNPNRTHMYKKYYKKLYR